MDKCEIIERLNNIAEHAVHTVGEEPFVMSLDDGIAVHEAIELLENPETNCSEIPNNSDTISGQQAIDVLKEKVVSNLTDEFYGAMQVLDELPSAQPEPEAISKWKKEFREYVDSLNIARDDWKGIIEYIDELPSAQPKTGHWILDRSGKYCCSKCMEPCATYMMMKPRDKFCKMCGSRNEVTE